MTKSSIEHVTFVLEKSYPQSPAKVFEFFSNAAKKRKWLGGEEEGFEIISYESAFKVGLFEHWKFRFKGGDLISNDTCYFDIVLNQRIVFVYSMAFGDKCISSSQVSIELFPKDGGTHLVHTEQGAFFDGIDQSAGRVEGQRGLYELLGKYLGSVNL